MKTLIIVDMQNDFITGSLANADAKAIIPGICKYIKEFDGKIILTRDTHYSNYLETQEGKNLPVPHCLVETKGWEVADEIKIAASGRNASYINKDSFGCLNIRELIPSDTDEIILVGTCTDICVVSNALILKAQYLDIPVTIISSLCAGTTKENHEAALQTMRMCQCNVI